MLNSPSAYLPLNNLPPLALGAMLLAAMVGVDSCTFTDPFSGLTVIDGITMPPKRFDHKYHGFVYIKYVPQMQMRDACFQTFSNKVIGGCSYHTTSCFIKIAKEKTNHRRKLLIRHEIGHCNGWPGDHPS